MKHHLRAVTILIAVAIMGTVTARATASTGMVSFRVEKGDTYTNLFGPDWEKAYRQNKVTVIRGGKPVTSPDILIEGSVVSVTEDVRVTPKASSRLAALKQRRAELETRLASLMPNLVTVPEGQATAEECRRRLSSQQQFAADVDFAARELAHLEKLAQNAGIRHAEPQHVPSWWIGVGGLLATVLAVAIFWKRQRPQYPEGAARYQEALAAVQSAFRNVRVG